MGMFIVGMTLVLLKVFLIYLPYYKNEYSLIVITNQSGIARGFMTKWR